jgi:hypothetical protein
MNIEMAYLLGLICGNGEVRRSNTATTVSVNVPHKKLLTESDGDVRIFVKASITDMRAVLEPLIGTGIDFIQQPNYSVLSLTKPNGDFLIREILRHVGNASSHEDMRISADLFNAPLAERVYFLRGFSDVTGYIRKSNCHFKKYMHRVYIEIPRNWGLAVDVCNLLKSADVPVQNINWGHPNMRDGNLADFKKGKPNSWKKEHQIKIWANEFEKIGFAVIHKKMALEKFSRELRDGISASGKDAASVTHKFYWQGKTKKKAKPREPHPSVIDGTIPAVIQGRNFGSWKEIAAELGYGE